MTQTNQKKILVTSGLPYSNGRLHVGHIAGAYLPADIYVRFLRLKGENVRFVCGSDDHGVAIMMTAEKEGKTPAEVSLYYSELQESAFKGLNIQFDVYGSTSRSKYHAKTSQDFFLEMYKKGFFIKERTRQFFDEAKDMFLPDRFVKGTCGFCGKPDQNSDQCENCGNMLDVDTLKDARSVQSGNQASIRETVQWFLDLSKFEKDVDAWLSNALLRDHTRTYVKGLLSSGLIKRAMTRDISWGIPVPLDDPDAKGKVLYVWFDAPIGYISNTKELCERKDGSPDNYTDWWKSDDCDIYHFIGEDNTIFHCLVWIAMLKAEGTFSLPRGVIVNQYLNIQFPGEEEQKMSKSRGQAVWIKDYLESGGNPDAMRYYLTSISPERARSTYRPEDLVQRNNSELANTLGNFVNRVISFTTKYFGPIVPEPDASRNSDIDLAFVSASHSAHERVTRLLENFEFKNALEEIMDFARKCNKYVDEKAPWSTRKTDMALTAHTLVNALNAIKLLSVLIWPFMPESSEKIVKMLSLPKVPAWDEGTVPLSAGSKLGEPEILFTKID